MVQGVGFRPFVFNLAKALGLSGFVRNDGRGVCIEVQGAKSAVRAFLNAVRRDAPPLSRITAMESFEVAPVGDEKKFLIADSSPADGNVTPVSPDMDVCDDCLREMFDPADRRHRYPFINCTNCGPRYTIVKKTPYDRPFTSMSEFAMCPECEREYHDPENRRFHAQPNACPVCGPSLSLYDARWQRAEADDVIKAVSRMLKDGAIAAIKGVGGYHLACDALNAEAVERLRQRKIRKEKPFAVMAASVADAREIVRIGVAEEGVLTSREKPIILLRKKREVAGIAPGLDEYGVFLPYAPLHHLLFADGAPRLLVATSGNISDEPIVFDEAELKERMGGIADCHLTHNRPIVWRCDDSVVRVLDAGGISTVRRSRGYVPSMIPATSKFPEILACGGDLKNVFCLTKGDAVIPGPHVGDLMNAEAFRSFKGSIGHFKNVFRIAPKIVAVDMHPAYVSSNYGRSLGLPVVEVQHHHAHVASVMAENGLKGEVIGVALDGTGYGPDGTTWGGEFLTCSYASFKRAGHFPALKLPGGDKAAKEPWRVAVAVLHEVYGDDFLNLPLAMDIGVARAERVVSMLKAGVNCPASTGAGRWFDAVSSILGVSHFNEYEGRSPMLLESVADKGVRGELEFSMGADGAVSFDAIIREIVDLKEKGEGVPKIAALFHNTIAKVVFDLCARIGAEAGLRDVCLGGGVFQNKTLLVKAAGLLELGGFRVYLPKNLPINDGGLSLGQAVVAAHSHAAGRI